MTSRRAVAAAAAPVMVANIGNVMSAVADIHRQRQASLQLLEQERTPRSQFIAALIEVCPLLLLFDRRLTHLRWKECEPKK